MIALRQELKSKDAEEQRPFDTTVASTRDTTTATQGERPQERITILEKELESLQLQLKQQQQQQPVSAKEKSTQSEQRHEMLYNNCKHQI